MFEITYRNGFKQTKKLVKTICEHEPYKSFTMYSPIYRCIEDGTFMLFGKYKLIIKELGYPHY